jgi:hypothetical protein
MELQKRKNQIKNKRYSLIIIVGIFLSFLGTIILIYNYYENKQQDKLDN